MPVDKSIFGLRFGSNAELQPTEAELNDFLARPKQAGKLMLHGDVLAPYLETLDRIEAFDRYRRVDSSSLEFRDKMFFGILGVTSLFNRPLATAMEQYVYQLHALQTLDFRKPEAFIRSAEQEIADLNPKKANDAAKIARLGGMVEERKRTIETLMRHRKALGEELGSIAEYIRDNLVKIEKLCEGSIVVLLDLQISGKEAARLIEDIKEEFKDRLKASRYHGQITAEDLEIAKKEVAELSDELASLLREDVYALTDLLEKVHDHAKKIAADVDAVSKRIKGARGMNSDDERKEYEQLGRVLESLASDCRFELKAVTLRAETGHEKILFEKRKEMLDHFLTLLQKERRVRSERRRSPDRRKFKDPNYKGPERRKKERRSGRNRR